MDTLRAGQARDSQLQGGRKKAEWRKAAALSLPPSFLFSFGRERQLCRGKGEQPLQAQNHRGRGRGEAAWRGRQAGEYVGLSAAAAAVLEVIFEIVSFSS